MEEEERDVKKRKTETGPVAMKAKGRKSNVPPPSDDDDVEVVEEPKKRGRPAKGKSEASARYI